MVQDDDIGASVRCVTIIGNSSGLSRLLLIVVHKNDLIIVLWYVGDGMKEGVFAEAR